MFRVIDSSMSLWDSNSIISRINRNDSLVEVDDHFRNVFTRSMEIGHSTDGAFDVTVGQFVRKWKSMLKDGTGTPDSVTVKQLLTVTGYTKLVERQAGVKTVPDIQLFKDCTGYPWIN